MATKKVLLAVAVGVGNLSGGTFFQFPGNGAKFRSLMVLVA
jgi:hypothetical protein